MEGRTAEPHCVREMEEWIEAWARFCDLLPRGTNGVSQLQTARRSSPTTATSAASRPPQSSSTEAPVTPPPAKPAAPKWPRLTPKEREAVQISTGLHAWYPFQPRNLVDPFWESNFERVARTARERLLRVYSELATLGRIAKSMDLAKDADPDALIALRIRVQTAYDAYLIARIQVDRLWTQYLNIGYQVIGVDVIALEAAKKLNLKVC